MNLFINLLGNTNTKKVLMQVKFLDEDTLYLGQFNGKVGDFKE